MRPPVTRSQSRKADEGSSTDPSSAMAPPPTPKFVDDIRNTLIDVDDNTAVLGKSAKELRDATASAVTEAWQDSRFSTASVAQQINDYTTHLLNELNLSFAAMGPRAQPPQPTPPSVMPCVPEGTLPNLKHFQEAAMSSFPVVQKVRGCHAHALFRAPHTVRLRVDEVLYITERKQLSVRLAALSWNHRRLRALVDQNGREEGGQYVVDGYILDIVYGQKPADQSPSKEADPQRPHSTYPTTFAHKGQTVLLTADQHAALALRLKGAALAATQAAFGTGKAIIGALVAVFLWHAIKGPAIVTASTNHAVAHFAITLLVLNDFNKLNLLRLISESAYLDKAPSITVGINEILKDHGLKHAASLSLDPAHPAHHYRLLDQHQFG
ncbi:unnamed protein product [Heligmosomoides polygyrus]|uniref:AAA_11 domain-containing protein n=1 Tax=Heligmosomoides polygyrus TaxID=6339 RepID=A0A183GCV9_HELPZ|nr:unnamed protein product [Heligmosomoides polygyrus]